MIKKKLNNLLYRLASLGSKPTILDRFETVQRISHRSRLSIARFGDGELGMILHKNNLGFQVYDEKLAERLREVLTDHMDNLLVCLPNVFQTTELMNDGPAEYWRSWVVNNKSSLMRILDKQILYGDAFITRLYIPWKNRCYEKEILSNIRSIWDGENLVIVEGSQTKCGVGNDLFSNARNVKRIICPAENAWDKYDMILSSCLSVPRSENAVFYLALGPTATVLASDLCKAGYRALDLGHLDLQYEYMLRGMDKKGIIPGKYNNEVSNGNNVMNINDSDYESSIIAKM